ncbi:MAG TPA: PfkB family carbohydrate kinase, partial [bacterium]
MIHLVSLNPALDFSFDLKEPSSGKIGEVLESQVEAGGKALNIARYLKKWHLKAATWLGTGGGNHPTNILYRALLQQEGLSARFLSDKAPIRFNVVLGNGKKSEKYNHPGFELDLAHFPRLLKTVKKNDLLVLTGRLPKGMNLALYGAWVRLFQRRGIRTVVDTSGKALGEALSARPWFFKVNLFEISEALGRKITRLEQTVFLIKGFFQKRGLTHGALTNGKEGAVLWRDGSIVWAKTPQSVQNPLVVGAGDAFL